MPQKRHAYYRDDITHNMYHNRVQVISMLPGRYDMSELAIVDIHCTLMQFPHKATHALRLRTVRL